MHDAYKNLHAGNVIHSVVKYQYRLLLSIRNKLLWTGQ